MSLSAANHERRPDAAPVLPADAVTVSTQVDAAEWNAYVSGHPDATVDHVWEWRAVFAGVFDQRCEYLAARRQGLVVGVLPLVLFRSALFGRFGVSVPFLNYGGVLADDEAAARALLEAAVVASKASGASHLELRHAARQFADLPYRQHKLGFVLELPGSGEALWKTIDRKIRNQVRKAQKEGLTVATGGAELVDEFYAVFSRNMRDLGTPVYSPRLFRATLESFPRDARVVIVRLGTRAVAGAVAIGFRDTVIVPWASSLREYRPLSPNTLLYWTMIEAAANDQRRAFDFGRSSPGGGTHQFKLQWGARETPLHWEYVMIAGGEPPNQGPSNPKFRAAIAVWQRLPLWLTTACGPHFARHLP